MSRLITWEGAMRRSLFFKMPGKFIDAPFYPEGITAFTGSPHAPQLEERDTIFYEDELKKYIEEQDNKL